MHIGIAQSFFAMFLLLSKRPGVFSDRLLAVWFFIIGVSMLESYLYLFCGLKNTSSGAVIYTYGPVLYLYVKTVIFEKPKLRLHDIVHFFPVIFVLLISLLKPEYAYVYYTTYDDTELIKEAIYGLTFIVLMYYYIVKTFSLLNKHTRNIDNNFSYKSSHISLKWIKYLSIVFSITFTITIVMSVFDFYNRTHIAEYFFIVSFTLIAFSYSYFSFKQPLIYKRISDLRYDEDIELAKINIDKQAKKQPKYERSGLKEEDSKLYLEKILNHLKNDKPYLNGDLTINEMSETLNIPKHFITQIINEKLNKNFYTLINEYRLEAVKSMIVDPEYNRFTLLAMAYECGFNSKSSFNNIFKKLTGKTPTQYRNELAEPSDK